MAEGRKEGGTVVRETGRRREGGRMKARAEGKWRERGREEW